MLIPPTPPDEEQRISSLRSLHILDTPAEERFDRITRIAVRLFQIPISLISLVDTDRQWFKSCQGLSFAETSRDVSFCGHAILSEETFVIPDPKLDPRFADNPLVTGDPHIRFYAGHPLHGPDGSRIGTLCLIGREPREWTESDGIALRDMAILAENELLITRLSPAQMDLIREQESLQKEATVDSLTRTWNQKAIVKILDGELARAKQERTSVGVILTDIDRLKPINNAHGNNAGDAVLREVAQRIRNAIRPQDAVARYGGEEFLIVLRGASASKATEVAEKIRLFVGKNDIRIPQNSIPVTISLGVAATEEARDMNSGSLINFAEEALTNAKSNGRNRVVKATTHRPIL